MNNIKGSKWWKFDFHAHTPASIDYRTRNNEEKVKFSEKDWLLNFMKKEIDCVVVTDHNTGKYIDKLKSTYSELENIQSEHFRKLFIFPGVEISVSGGIHLLGIFDLSYTSENIIEILAKCDYKGTHGDSDAVTTVSMEKAIKIVIENGGIAIPAHVDKEKGLFQVLSGPSLKQVLLENRENLLALEITKKNYDFPQIYRDTKMNLSKVVGSDSHSAEEVGEKYTWVKMSRPNIEALRLALHDGEDGIQRYNEIEGDPNKIHDKYFLKEIKIEKGFKAGNGKPLVASFSPWMNSIIGGRGTGKSSLINYLRIVFDQTKNMPDTVQGEFNNFNKIGTRTSEGMLKNNTMIIIEVIRNGILYKIKWENGKNQNKHEVETYNEADAKWEKYGNVDDVKSLFPLQVYSQKEIYELTKEPSKLLEIIDFKFDKKTWNDEIRTLRNEWKNKKLKKIEIERRLLEKNDLKIKLNDIKNRIKIIEDSKNSHILNEYKNFKNLKKKIEERKNEISNFSEKLNDLSNELVNLEVLEENKLFEPETVNNLNSINSSISKVKEKFSGAVHLLVDINEKINKLFSSPWYKKYLKAESKYKEYTKREKEIEATKYDSLLEEKKIIRKQLKEIEESEKNRILLISELKNLKKDIIKKEKELREKRYEVISKINNSNDTGLKVILEPMGDINEAISSFRTLIRKTSEFEKYIYKKEEDEPTGIIAKILSTKDDFRWDVREKEIAKLINADENSQSDYGKRFINHIQYLQDNYPEDIANLEIWVPEDKLKLKLIKNERSVNVEAGSAGERTAAMLGLIISDNKVPLIIDQPEDDLDTKLISSFIVENFKAFKNERQLIIITHNPNIAVNANSENIIYMNFRRGQIEVEENDALQNKVIRKAVCDVMEGGREALERRYFRISKALQ